MPIVQIIVVLLVLALVGWLLSSYVLPHVAEPFRTIIVVVLAIALCLWLLSLVGVIGPMSWNLHNR